MEIYVVKQGDMVDGIAALFGADVNAIIYDNQLTVPYAPAVGQALLIEDGITEDPQRMPVRSSGYAYPFISSIVLQQTLPFLTEISVFSYGFTPEGKLVPPPADDTWIVERARLAGTAAILTLTPFNAAGRFSSSLIHAVVKNPAARENLITELLAVMTEKGYAGLDIDFEYIFAGDRDAFTEFVRRCAQRLHPCGYSVTVALAPKTSAAQKGLLYEGIDYRALGEIADGVLLMTYDWGYKYGPNMAVAPFHKVREVVKYAVTEVAPEKISLGIANYGYDWPLPFERGITRAVNVSNTEAARIAAANEAEIYFDETAKSPYFRYTAEGVEHEVWFEDVRSLQAKFDLIPEFGLRGVGYWNIMQFFRANWLLLENHFALYR